jgi:NADH:ubiquinone oxidoreductase subunit 3 (subunit A)
MAAVFWTIVVFVFVVATIGIVGFVIARVLGIGSDHHQPQH